MFCSNEIFPLCPAVDLWFYKLYVPQLDLLLLSQDKLAPFHRPNRFLILPDDRSRTSVYGEPSNLDESDKMPKKMS